MDLRADMEKGLWIFFFKKNAILDLLASTRKRSGTVNTSQPQDNAVAFHLYFNKQNFPEDQKSKTATLASHPDQAVVIHTFNPSSHTSLP